jgi:hypothetical protein
VCVHACVRVRATSYASVPYKTNEGSFKNCCVNIAELQQFNINNNSAATGCGTYRTISHKAIILHVVIDP